MTFDDVAMDGLFRVDGLVFNRLPTTQKRIWATLPSGHRQRVKNFVNARAVDLDGKPIQPAAYRFFWRETPIDEVIE